LFYWIICNFLIINYFIFVSFKINFFKRCIVYAKVVL
jgi:hypothetical protein